MFQRAREAEQAGGLRKHHLVPRAHLARWARNGLIRVSEVGKLRSFLSSPENAARQTDYYNLAAEGLDPKVVPPLLFEVVLGEIEDRAFGVIDHLLKSGVSSLNTQERYWLSVFLGFQHTRGESFRHGARWLAREAVKMTFEGVSDEDIRERLKRRRAPSDDRAVGLAREGIDDLLADKLVVEPQDAQVVGMGGENGFVVGGAIFAARWYIFESSTLLITCDEPVVPVGGPSLPRAETAGLAMAAAVMFPLSPHRLLVGFHPGKHLSPTALEPTLLPNEVSEINGEIAAHARRWVFESPGTRQTASLSMPLPPPAFGREGPLAGPIAESGEVYRFFRPSRWWCASNPPDWPVARWWND